MVCDSEDTEEQLQWMDKKIVTCRSGTDQEMTIEDVDPPTAGAGLKTTTLCPQMLLNHNTNNYTYVLLCSVTYIPL